MSALFNYFQKCFARSLLGIDISAHAIYVACFLQQKKGFVIQHYAKKILPAEKSNPEFIVATLRQILEEENIQIKSAAIAIDYAAALFKTIEVDASLTAAEIWMHVEQRVSQYLNQSLEHSLLDFEVLGPAPNNAKLKLVKWVVTKKQPVVNYIDILKQAGLTTVVVDINAYALQRAAYQCARAVTQKAKGSLAVLYRNDTTLLFTVSANDMPCYVLSEPCQTDFAVEKVLLFVQRALQLYQQSVADQPITEIVLVGQVASVEVVASLEQQTKISTKITDASVLKPKKGDQLSIDDSPILNHEYLLSIGLAMHPGYFGQVSSLPRQSM